MVAAFYFFSIFFAGKLSVASEIFMDDELFRLIEDGLAEPGLILERFPCSSHFIFESSLSADLLNCVGVNAKSLMESFPVSTLKDDVSIVFGVFIVIYWFTDFCLIDNLCSFSSSTASIFFVTKEETAALLSFYAFAGKNFPFAESSFLSI